MECKKVKFSSPEEASKRSNEINNKNKKTKYQKQILRPYKCDFCDGYHLTKMVKSTYKHNTRYRNDLKYRNDIHEKAFIKRESEHWENYFGVNK